MEPRTFRQSSCIAIVGAVIGIVGAVLAGIAAYHLATGIPLMQADSKFEPGEHAASMDELWFGIVGGLPFLLLGIALILSNLNSAITINEEGIVATNLFKRPYFQANWREVTAVERVDSRPGSGYRVDANGKTLRIDASMPHMKDLIAEIQKRITA